MAFLRSLSAILTASINTCRTSRLKMAPKNGLRHRSKEVLWQSLIRDPKRHPNDSHFRCWPRILKINFRRSFLFIPQHCWTCRATRALLLLSESRALIISGFNNAVRNAMPFARGASGRHRSSPSHARLSGCRIAGDSLGQSAIMEQ